MITDGYPLPQKRLKGYSPHSKKYKLYRLKVDMKRWKVRLVESLKK
jgi:hypothetical protein